MTTQNQNLTLFQGEDIDIPVVLTDVTLTGTETIKATFRDRGQNRVMWIATATKTPPSTLTISLDSATTAAMRATEGGPLHDWSVWREDEGSRTPYLTGTVTVVDTARP